MDPASSSAAAAASTMNAMNMLQQISQYMFLQSLAATAASAGKTPFSMNPAMFGIPQPQQQQKQQFPSTPKLCKTEVPTLPSMSPPSNGSSPQFQTIADILASHQNLKTELSPTTSTSSSDYSSFKMFETPMQQRQYRVHVNRESAKPLQEWMNQHITDPYPSHRDVQQLSKVTGFTYKQIRNWFTNSRRRFEQQCSAHSLPLPWIKKDAPKVFRKIHSSDDNASSSP